MSGEMQFDALSDRQLDALCNVAFGGHGSGIAPRTLASLHKRGLIEPVERHDRQGNLLFAITTWTMPLHVHVAFCAWCSTQKLLDLEDL